MCLRIAGFCLLALIFAGPAAAQHGTAETGLYSFNYRGDTWTGTLSAVDHDQDSVTLTYEHKGKTETFTGVFKHPLEVVDENGRPSKVHTHLDVGDRITAYYIAQGLKYSEKHDGHRADEVAAQNLIFKIKLLPPEKKR